MLASGAGARSLVKLNKIYTRTGDGGSAGLVDGSRVSKASARMAAIGEVDEANCAIGMAIALLDGELADGADPHPERDVRLRRRYRHAGRRRCLGQRICPAHRRSGR